MNDRTAIFKSTPIPQAIATLALPTMFSMLVNIIYNMADTFFVGQTGDEYQVAAVSLTLPIFLLFNALGSLFGAGGGAYISRLLGSGQKDKTKKVSAFSYYGSIFAGLILLAVLLLFMNPILNFSGATNNTFNLAKEYLTIIAFGGFSIVVQTSFAQVVRSEGAAKESMIGMILGSVLNIILDPIMILWLNMGVVGAAWATLIGNLVAAIYYTIYCSSKKSILSVSVKDFAINREIVLNVFSIGIPQAIMNILMSISTVALNFFAAQCMNGDEIIAGFGIANRVNTIVVMLMIGLGQGIQPLVGYNFSAANYTRMKQTIRYASLYSIILGIILMICFLAIPETIIRVFIDNATVVDYGVKLLNALAVIAPIFGIQYIILNTFQAMGKSIPAFILSVTRQGVFFMAALFIGFKLFGVTGLIWAQSFADTGCVVLSIILYLVIAKQTLKAVK
ncbi:MAG: MATE family efflux transporter [Lachnospiraceae bacterium]|nr:MATE family efflux transporter [Lachnospiraceae bacterium]